MKWVTAKQGNLCWRNFGNFLKTFLVEALVEAVCSVKLIHMNKGLLEYSQGG